jgi:hypothetical protein
VDRALRRAMIAAGLAETHRAAERAIHLRPPLLPGAFLDLVRLAGLA